MTLELPPLDVAMHAGCCHVSGELVGESAVTMSTTLHQLASAEKSAGFDLDLSGVSFIDSVGLRELLRLRHSLPSVQLIAVSGLVRRRLDLTGTAGLLLGPHRLSNEEGRTCYRTGSN